MLVCGASFALWGTLFVGRVWLVFGLVWRRSAGSLAMKKNPCSAFEPGLWRLVYIFAGVEMCFYSQTIPSQSQSFMYSYAGCPRRNGRDAVGPGLVAPDPAVPVVVVHGRGVNFLGRSLGGGVAVAVEDSFMVGASTSMSVESELARTASMASALVRSMVRRYSGRTWTMRSTYQQAFRSGSHSAVSLSSF